MEIFDLTINKALQENYSYEIEDILNKIYIYVNDYKIASHLLSVYSKIYLSLSLFYSTNKLDLEKAKTFYAIFIQMNGSDILQNDYKNLNLEILNNINVPSDLILKEFLDNKNKQLKNEIINIKNRVNIIPNDEIKASLANFISNNIFHGLCETYILKKEEELITFDIGFEESQIKTNKYLIRLIFTSLYKKNFLEVYEQNILFIENEILKILNNLKDKNEKFNILIDSEDEIEINY